MPRVPWGSLTVHAWCVKREVLCMCRRHAGYAGRIWPWRRGRFYAICLEVRGAQKRPWQCLLVFLHLTVRAVPAFRQSRKPDRTPVPGSPPRADRPLVQSEMFGDGTGARGKATDKGLLAEKLCMPLGIKQSVSGVTRMWE